jgi:hypothetical protein
MLRISDADVDGGCPFNVEECMKRAIFVVVSLSYCIASNAANAARSASVQVRKSAQPELQQLQRVPLIFQNSRAPGFCIGTAGGDMKARTPVKQGACDLAGASPSVARDQVWVADRIGRTDKYEVKNLKNEHMCLGVDHGRRGRADILLGACNGHPDQAWRIRFPQNPSKQVLRVRLENANSLCVGVEGGKTTRAQLKQNQCFTNPEHPDQIWIAVPVDPHA